MVVLVADDEAYVRAIVRIALESLGMFVLTAGDGREALRIVGEYAGKIHVLVSDILMPHLDGLALCEHIRREYPAMKVLLISGTCEGPEGVPFLRKPFTMGQLKERVQQLVTPATATRPRG